MNKNSNSNGFIYMDILLAVSIFMILLPTVLSLYGHSIESLSSSYERDWIINRSVSLLETAKAKYYENGLIDNLKYTDPRYSDIYYESSSWKEDKFGEIFLAYQVTSYKNLSPIYSLRTYLSFDDKDKLTL
mgnify:FL=1